MIRHDVDLNKLSYDVGINAYLNFSRLKAAQLPKSLRVASKEVAFAGVAKTFAALLSADFCWKDIWTRPTTHLSCKSGWYQGGSGLDVGFCYKKCNSGYGRFGDHCWGHCPSNYNDLGAYCQREWLIGISTKNKHVYHEPGCSITSSKCAECPGGYYMAGLRCYQSCKPGYSCSSDAALTGELRCKSHLPTDCGAGCASDSGSCVRNTFEIIQGLLDAAVSSAVLVLSFGASAAAKISAEVVENSAKKTLKNAAKLKMRTIQKAFVDGVKGATWEKVEKEMVDNMKGKIEQKAQDLYVAYALSETETLVQQYLDKFKKGGWDQVNTVVQDIDPTGIASAIDGSTGDEVDDVNKQVANWMNVISFVDPTGIVGAAAGIIKHSHCESTLAKIDAKMEEPIVVPFEEFHMEVVPNGCSSGSQIETLSCQHNYESAQCEDHGKSNGYKFTVDDCSARCLSVPNCVMYQIQVNAGVCWFFSQPDPDGLNGGAAQGWKCGTKKTGAEACNWGCYLERYPDLRKLFGSDQEKARVHWANYGEGEGRNCNCPEAPVLRKKGCPDQGTGVEAGAAESTTAGGVQCCSNSGDTCFRDGSKDKSFAESVAICTSSGKRLCTVVEIDTPTGDRDGLCCGKGHSIDSATVWALQAAR